jgi:hypothetical protein
VIYGTFNPSDYGSVSVVGNQYPNGTPRLDGTGDITGMKAAAKFPFSRNVMPIIASGSVSPTTTPSYTLMGSGTAVGWYYHYRTGFVFQTPGLYPPAVDIGVPAVPGVTVGTPQAFGVASLDLKYKIAVAVYKIGLLNAQDVN